MPQKKPILDPDLEKHFTIPGNLGNPGYFAEEGAEPNPQLEAEDVERMILIAEQMGYPAGKVPGAVAPKEDFPTQAPSVPPFQEQHVPSENYQMDVSSLLAAGDARERQLSRKDAEREKQTLAKSLERSSPMVQRLYAEQLQNLRRRRR